MNTSNWLNKRSILRGVTLAMVTAIGASASSLAAAHDQDDYSFEMVHSAGVTTCLPNAKATVHIESEDGVEEMKVKVEGLPPHTSFDLFVLQVPKSPFGVAWYLGDINTNGKGKGSQRFIGRFSIETFSVAPGTAPAPVVFSGPFPDASLNPPFNPIQQYHLGLWFNDPQDAQEVGCPATVTPFNGEHNAGIQVLNTSNFPDDKGPLINVTP
jgi:hypothetical protein